MNRGKRLRYTKFSYGKITEELFNPSNNQQIGILDAVGEEIAYIPRTEM